MMTAARFERGPMALLDNAARHAPQGSFRVHAGRERAGTVLPQLGDGQGIPPGERPYEAPVGARLRPARCPVAVGAASANSLPIATSPEKGKVAA